MGLSFRLLQLLEFVFQVPFLLIAFVLVLPDIPRSFRTRFRYTWHIIAIQTIKENPGRGVWRILKSALKNTNHELEKMLFKERRKLQNFSIFYN
jgi:hypothetical protein